MAMIFSVLATKPLILPCDVLNIGKKFYFSLPIIFLYSFLMMEIRELWTIPKNEFTAYV